MDQINEYSNITANILQKIGLNLHNKTNHPICIMKEHLYTYFRNNYGCVTFDSLSPVVSVDDNFDKLLIPSDHPARSKSDTYYINETSVLRTHTTAHQNNLLMQGYKNFLVTGDVYRKDEIDKYHYPVFHQMEGIIKITSDGELFTCLNNLVGYMFPGCEYRINNDYFPFTNPSYEVEVFYNNKWIEILGCGIVHNDILKKIDTDEKYLAFGLGLERLCMIYFEIPDIRYFWSTNDKFINQFESGITSKFKPYSDLSSQSDDISFWIENDNIIDNKWNQENDFFEIVRNNCGEFVESVTHVETFVHPKTKKTSRLYRIIFSPDTSNLKNQAEFTKLRIQMFNDLKNIIKESNLEITLR